MQSLRRSCRWMIIALLCIGPSCLAGPATQPATNGQAVTAVLSALTLESSLLEQSLADKQVQHVLGIRFVTGRMQGRNVVLAVSGMGKVNAAVVSALLIDRFHPQEMLFSGIAGCLNPQLGLGDIVIADRTVQHDLLTLERDKVSPMEIFSPVDGKKNPQYFPADGRLLKIAQAAALRIRPEDLKTARQGAVPRIVTGLVVTGDMFIGADSKKKELQQRYHADAVEMEGASVAQVCWQFGVPCLIIRSVSDLADNAADADVETFMKVAADNAGMLVKQIVAGLAGSPLAHPSAAPVSAVDTK